MKNKLGYDDSLDAFGVHGVGGFVGAVLTGVFCSALVNPGADGKADGPFAYSAHRARLEALKKDDSKLIADAKKATDEANKAVEAKEKELKVEELTAAVSTAQETFDKAPAESKGAAEEALKTAKDKLKGPTADAVQPLKEIATDKADAQKKLEDELDEPPNPRGQAKDDKEHDGKEQEVVSVAGVHSAQGRGVLGVVFVAFVVSLGLVYMMQAAHARRNFRRPIRSPKRTVSTARSTVQVGFDFFALPQSGVGYGGVGGTASGNRAYEGNGRFEGETDRCRHEGTDEGVVRPVPAPKTGRPCPDADFLAVYPHVTTIRGTTFRCRGGDANEVAKHLQAACSRAHTGQSVTAAAPVAVH